MESTSNEGNQKRKELKTKEISKDSMEKLLNSKQYEDFNLNCMAFDAKENIKSIDDKNIVSSSSADFFEFHIEEMEAANKWVNVYNVNLEKLKMRKAYKKKIKAQKENQDTLNK